MKTMQVLPIWGLAIPLPAVLIITLSLYMVILGIGLLIRFYLKDHCSSICDGCCPNISCDCEQCSSLAEICNCKLPSMRSCWTKPCPDNSLSCLECACVCQPPDFDSCNCFCFEIRVR